MAEKTKTSLSGTATTSSTVVATLKAPSLPTSPAGMADFIAQGHIAISIAEECIKTCPKGSADFLLTLAFGQHVANMVLDEGLKIADKVRAVGNTVGSGPEVEKARKEKEKIMVSHGFKEGKRWRNICELDADCVNKAKDRAIKNGDIPSINAAIKLKPKGKKKSRIPRAECHGVLSDTVLPKGIKFDETWNATSLFANIGLGTYMLKDLNIKVAVANELLKKRTDIHKALYGNNCDVITGSITEENIYQKILAAHKANNCRIVLMSCPCQFFSKAGKQHINRDGATLILKGMQFVEDSKPDVFMCENVPEFLGACPDKIKGEHFKTICDYIEQTSDRLGYITNIDYLDADNYGTGETRERSIVLGIKKKLVQKILGTTEITADNVWKFPKPDEFKMSEEICLLGIPSIEACEHRIDFNRLHFAPDLKPEVVEALKNMSAGEKTTVMLPSSKTEGEFDEVGIKRAYADEPAPTITGESGHFGAPANYFPAGRIRTDGTQSDARYRTPYEILVLMGMPRDFELPEKIKIRDGKGNIWCKSGPVPESDPTAIQPGDIVVTDDEFRTMLGEHYCPTVVNRCFAQLVYQIQHKDF